MHMFCTAESLDIQLYSNEEKKTLEERVVVEDNKGIELTTALLPRDHDADVV